MTATPADDVLVATHTMKIKTELDLYPDHAVHYTSLTVNVQGAICDQNGLGWTASDVVEQTIDVATGPTEVNIAPYLVDENSKTATPEMRACGGFDESYTLTAVESG